MAAGGKTDVTRRRILRLLQEDPRTVSGLSRDLEISGTAVRKHLDRLQVEGLVRQEGRHRGAGRPAATFGLTRQGEAVFRRDRDKVLESVLAAIHADRDPAEVRRLLRDAGARLARRMVREAGEDLDEAAGEPGEAGREGRFPDHEGGNGRAEPSGRMRTALRLLDRLGGRERIRRTEGGVEIVGFVCPLGELVADHPGTCQLVAGFVQEVLGVPVEDRCSTGAAAGAAAGKPVCVLEACVGPGGEGALPG